MVAKRAFLLMAMLASPCFAFLGGVTNPVPTGWSVSWRAYDEDSTYTPGKQEFIELATAINERELAVDAIYGRYDWYGEPDGYLSTWWTPWINVPALFGIEYDGGSWTDSAPFMLQTEDWIDPPFTQVNPQDLMTWGVLVERTLKLLTYFIPTNLAPGSICSYLNSTNFDYEAIANRDRIRRESGDTTNLFPFCLPLYNHDTAFAAAGIPYAETYDPGTTFSDRRIVAGLLVETNAHKIPLAEWAPALDTNGMWAYTNTFPGDFVRWWWLTNTFYETRFRQPGRDFVVLAELSASNLPKQEVSMQIYYEYLDENQYRSPTNRTKGWASKWPMWYPSLADLYVVTNGTASITTPWETNLLIISVTNVEFPSTFTNAAGMPKIFMGYTNLALYGARHAPTPPGASSEEYYNLAGESVYGAANPFPTWKSMHHLRRLLQTMKRVPAFVGPICYDCQSGGWYDYGKDWFCTDETNCPTVACSSGMPSTNEFPDSFGDPSWIQDTNHQYNAGPVIRTPWGPNDEVFDVGSTYRWQLLPWYCPTNTATSTWDLRLFGRYNKFDGAWVKLANTAGMEKVSSVTVLYSAPYTVTSTGIYYHAVQSRADARLNNASAPSASHYAYNDSSSSFTYTNRAFSPSGHYLIFDGVMADAEDNAEDYLDSYLKDVAGDYVYEDEDEIWKVQLNYIYMAITGYLEYDFDLD